MIETNVLIVTGLEMEFEAAREAALQTTPASNGVLSWDNCDESGSAPYLRGIYLTTDGRKITVALARPTRMGSTSTLAVAGPLAERLRPSCLAMCGVCAGNPGEVALGDVIIAEMAYVYDEGKLKLDGFEGDHRQIPMRDTWVRGAQELRPDGLPSFRATSGDDGRIWLLERLYSGDDPQKHPGRGRYFPKGSWRNSISNFLQEKLVRRKSYKLELTKKGRSQVEERQLLEAEPPEQLPFQIRVGPMATGNVVVKDGLTWDKLAKWGVRSALGLDMEAAAIAALAHRLGIPNWIVAKGVMDHADPRKEDRYKPFAARASAEVLFHFLLTQHACFGGKAPETVDSSIRAPLSTPAAATALDTNTCGDVKPRDSLFELYRPEYEPHYVVREIDRDVEEALQGSCLWLYGAPGLGKTNTITRYLSRAKAAHYVCISLASCLDGKLKTILEHIYIEICQYNNVEPVKNRNRSNLDLIQDIKAILRCFDVKSKIYIYIDEIPIESRSLFKEFTHAVAAIFSSTTIAQPKLEAYLIASSIQSPREFVAPSQKNFLQTIRLIELKPWSLDELTSLIATVNGTLKITFTTEQTHLLLEAANGSPRFIKKALGTCLLHLGNQRWPLERIIEETKWLLA